MIRSHVLQNDREATSATLRKVEHYSIFRVTLKHATSTKLNHSRIITLETIEVMDIVPVEGFNRPSRNTMDHYIVLENFKLM